MWIAIIDIDMRDYMTMRAEAMNVNLVALESNAARSPRGSELANSTNLLTRRDTLYRCILALTSPELLWQRRRAWIPVTPPTTPTIRRGPSARRTSQVKRDIVSVITLDVTIDRVRIRRNLRAITDYIIDKGDDGTTCRTPQGGDFVTLATFGLLYPVARRRLSVAPPRVYNQRTERRLTFTFTLAAEANAAPGRDPHMMTIIDSGDRMTPMTRRSQDARRACLIMVSEGSMDDLDITVGRVRARRGPMTAPDDTIGKKTNGTERSVMTGGDYMTSVKFGPFGPVTRRRLTCYRGKLAAAIIIDKGIRNYVIQPMLETPPQSTVEARGRPPVGREEELIVAPNSFDNFVGRQNAASPALNQRPRPSEPVYDLPREPPRPPRWTTWRKRRAGAETHRDLNRCQRLHARGCSQVPAAR